MGNDTKKTDSPTGAMREGLWGAAQKQLTELRDHLVENGVSPLPAPLVPKDQNRPGRDWLPKPEWISGGDAFEILRLQTEPYQYAPAIARICNIIAGQWDIEESGLNYALASLPPSHKLLRDFAVGSNQWFLALYRLLTLKGAEIIEDWEGLVSDLYEWIVMYDDLRIRLPYVFDGALTLDWHYHHYSLPEAKQEPIWSFPKAMAWIATRDYLALARMGHFRRPEDDDEAVAQDGVCNYNTQALGWLHTAITFAHCECGARRDFGFEAIKHCTCISVAWEELVRFKGGLSPNTPELVFNIQEGWLSMTWPDGANDIRFLRRDILDRWPALPADQLEASATEHSTMTGEQQCRDWLVKEFAADPNKRRSKGDFRKAALAAFAGRLSERGFNLRVWPELAREHGRDGAGAKRKS
ncbi:hypothetical protein [uncultured Sphingosinicella sp.]|uniref:hypothetical protein n=1 Tax=uncultured Sphingosinicella sp. TaxID=478748 RepID=UPI0030DBB538